MWSGEGWFRGGGESHVPESECSLSHSWTRGIGEPFVAFPLLSWLDWTLWMERSSSVWKRWCMCVDVGGELCLGVVWGFVFDGAIWRQTVWLVFTFMRLADAFMMLDLHLRYTYNQLMIRSVYQIYFNTQAHAIIAGVCLFVFCVYFSAFIYALTFVLLVWRFYLKLYYSKLHHIIWNEIKIAFNVKDYQTFHDIFNVI